MKRTIKLIPALIISLLIQTSLIAQTWQKIYPLFNGAFYQSELVSGEDGDIHVVSLDTNLLTTLDINGDFQWVYNFDDSLRTFPSSIKILPDGNLLVGGYGWVDIPGTNPKYQFISKVSNAGVPIWEKTYPYLPISLNGVADLAVVADGYYLGNNGGLLKTDLDGNEIWRETGAVYSAESIAPAVDGGVVLLGYNDPFGGISDLVLQKVNPDGSLGWSKIYGDQFEKPGDIAPTSDGGFIVAGNQRELGGGTYSEDVYLVRIDGDGELVWESLVGNTNYRETPAQVVEAADGSFLIACSTTQFNHSRSTLQKVDSEGNFLWEQHYLVGDLFTVDEALDGNLIIGGVDYSTNESPFLIRSDEEGNIYQNAIKARMIHDINYDCAFNSLDRGGEYWEVRATRISVPFSSTYSLIGVADEDGYISLPVDTGEYQISLRPNGSDWVNCNPPVSQVEFTSFGDTIDLGDLLLHQNPSPVNYVSGIVFQDLDGDCELDPGEPGMGNISMRMKNPNGPYSFLFETNPDGSYLVEVFSSQPSMTYEVGPDVANCTACADTVILNGLAVPYTDFNIGLQCSSAAPQTISGQFVIDENMDCDYDAGEPDFVEWSFDLVKIGSMDTISRTVDDYYPFGTDPGAFFDITVDTGQYYMEVTSHHPLYQPCQSLLTLDVGLSGIAPLFIPMMAIEECPLLSVDVGSAQLRVCQANSYFVNYCNEGNLPAEDAFVEIILPADLSITSGSIPYTQSGNVASFDLGNVEPGDCGGFGFHAFLDCDSEVGETHCVEAHIYPDSTCSTLNAQWDGSNVELSADCVDDMLILSVTNAGWGDMSEAINVFIVEDNVLIRDTSVQLVSGSSEMITIFPNGATIVVEAGQTPGHPSSSLPVVAVEGCGGGEISLGFVTQYVQPYEGFVAIDCRESTGSFDPNIKEAQPKGITDQHYIRPETELNYQVTFQNLGTDTAFEVVILDTLSQNLDTTGLRMGASSHPYEWEILEENILRVSFPGIELPHADVDESGSIGFVKFRLRQTSSNGPGTVIENQAGIYFDFNPPVITNTVTHRIPEPQMFEYQTITLCEGEAYNGQIFTENTTVMDTVRYLFFDSIFVTEIQILPQAESYAEASICEGETFSFGGEPLTDPGEYTHVSTGHNGCDSTSYLTLSVNNSTSGFMVAEICEGESYSFGGEVLTTPGDYTHVSTGANGCDSTSHLTLTVNTSTSGFLTATICNGETYSFGGTLLTEAGDYSYVFTGANGCDSTSFLTLEVNSTTAGFLAAEICEGETYPFGGELLTVSGDYTHVSTGFNGCDSTSFLALTVNTSASGFLTAEICEGETYPFGGELLTEPGDYTNVSSGSNGCDSTSHLTLVVNTSATGLLEAEICEGESYLFGDLVLTEPGEYTDITAGSNGCDSTTALTLIVFPITSSELDTLVSPGTTVYEVEINSDTTFTVVVPDENGCDMEVTINANIVVSSSEAFSPESILEIIPNPNNGEFLIRGELSKRIYSSAHLRNIYGQEIATIWENEKLIGEINRRINLSELPSGIYFVEWQGDGWRQVSKVVVE